MRDLFQILLKRKNNEKRTSSSILLTTLLFAFNIAHASPTLYAVSGDGANTPESLFTLDQTTGVPTLVTALGNGDDGEAIAYNPNDGLIYHASGLGVPNTDEIFETINPTTLTINNIGLSGDDYRELIALTFNPFTNGFLG